MSSKASFIIGCRHIADLWQMLLLCVHQDASANHYLLSYSHILYSFFTILVQVLHQHVVPKLQSFCIFELDCAFGIQINEFLETDDVKIIISGLAQSRCFRILETLEYRADIAFCASGILSFQLIHRLISPRWLLSSAVPRDHGELSVRLLNEDVTIPLEFILYKFLNSIGLLGLKVYAEQELDAVIFKLAGEVSHVAIIDPKGPLLQLSQEALSRGLALRLGSLVRSLLLWPRSLEI